MQASSIVKRIETDQKSKNPSVIPGRKKGPSFLNDSPFELDTFIIKIQEAVVLVQMTFLANNTPEVPLLSHEEYRMSQVLNKMTHPAINI